MASKTPAQLRAAKRWRDANKAKRAAYQAQWQAENRDKSAANQRAYRERLAAKRERADSS